MDNLSDIRTLTHMILHFVYKQIIKSFVNISLFYKINRHTKTHVVIKKSVLFAMFCVRKPLVNGFKMTINYGDPQRPLYPPPDIFNPPWLKQKFHFERNKSFDNCSKTSWMR